MGLDPVCKMEVNPASAGAQSEYGGQTFYFCSVECKAEFDRDPERYLDETDRVTRRGLSRACGRGSEDLRACLSPSPSRGLARRRRW